MTMADKIPNPIYTNTNAGIKLCRNFFKRRTQNRINVTNDCFKIISFTQLVLKRRSKLNIQLSIALKYVLCYSLTYVIIF